MGVKVKGGMYCQRCDKPVMAQKSGHGVRNTLSVGGVLATGGLSLLGTKSEKWCCPFCGGPVIKEKFKGTPTISEALASRAQRKHQEKELGEGKLEWRCEKNNHLLDQRKRPLVCPIDGSSAGWRKREPTPPGSSPSESTEETAYARAKAAADATVKTEIAPTDGSP